MQRFSPSCALILRVEYPSLLDEQEIIHAPESRPDNRLVPIIWNLRKGVSVPPAEERDLLPQGRFGIPHALLRPEELKEELLFTRSGDHEEILDWLFPAAVDPYRSSMRNLYFQRGRLLIDIGDELLILDKGNRRRLPLFRLKRDDESRLRRTLKLALRASRRTKRPSVLLAVPENPAAAAALSADVNRLSKRYRLRGVELSELLEESRRGTETEAMELLPHSGDNPLPADPLNRFRRSIPWEQPSQGRLFLLARNHRQDSAGYPGGATPPRGLIAHMPGEVTMEEEELTLRIIEGEAAGLELAGGPEIFPFPADPVLVIDGQAVRTQRSGSFSFQEDPVRGLRDTISFAAPHFNEPGTLVRDYFFVAGERRLCLSYFIRYPVTVQGREIDLLALGELPLFAPEPNEPVRLYTNYPDGEEATTLIPAPGNYLLYGQRFTFSVTGGFCTIEFAEYQGVVHELPVSLRLPSGKCRSHARPVLYINPGGSYTGFRAGTLEKLAEQFSLIITLSREFPAAPFPAAPLLPHLELYRVALG